MYQKCEKWRWGAVESDCEKFNFLISHVLHFLNLYKSPLWKVWNFTIYMNCSYDGFKIMLKPLFLDILYICYKMIFITITSTQEEMPHRILFHCLKMQSCHQTAYWQASNLSWEFTTTSKAYRRKVDGSQDDS